MTLSATIVLACLFSVIALSTCVGTVLDRDDGNGTMVVVIAGPTSAKPHCISLDGVINGVDALKATGSNITIDQQQLGPVVCKIGEYGCPENDCFCSCAGTPCVYWEYFHLINGKWESSKQGAGDYRVSAGTVDGWLWNVAGASLPPGPFIC
mmetsp:Transcript_22915/g.25488  ORF Transcript_22915/g.25488 Transcript_22915/m.25488 type:complete len:152 (+) Transcript_22915:42-497(+)